MVPYKLKNKELVPLFKKLKAILSQYEDKFVVQDDVLGDYGLLTNKEVEINGRKKKNLYFAGLIIQKSYVGFYFMPIYFKKDLAKYFEPELLSKLKGKSCFYIKKDDPIIMKQIKNALEMGLKMYKTRGWI